MDPVIASDVFFMPCEKDRSDLDHFGVSDTDDFEHKNLELKKPFTERSILR